MTKHHNKTRKYNNRPGKLNFDPDNSHSFVTNPEMSQTSVESWIIQRLVEESRSRKKSITSTRLRLCLTYRHRSLKKVILIPR